MSDFEKWWADNQRRFHTTHMSDREIAESAWSAAQAERIRELEGQLANSVPRSRYDACNADWLAEKAKREELAANAKRLIESAEQRLEKAEKDMKAIRDFISSLPEFHGTNELRIVAMLNAAIDKALS